MKRKYRVVRIIGDEGSFPFLNPKDFELDRKKFPELARYTQETNVDNEVFIVDEENKRYWYADEFFCFLSEKCNEVFVDDDELTHTGLVLL